ncbi:MAG TPA: molybdopterin-synthase adenylyltransferase MoeB [Ktedonobacterales bacterium]|nr:molybdopterin-synthase adenylyltransferase MoeB [Ktedonobacterales bacterium]
MTGAEHLKEVQQGMAMGTASRELMRRARSEIKEWSPAQVKQHLADGDITLVDVREKHEWDEGYIPGAIHVPRGYLELDIEEAVPDKDKPLVLYCAGGVRSVLAADTLKRLGYREPISMAGGFGMWKGLGFSFTQPRVLTQAQAKRYSRHLLVPEVGEQGQLKLLDAKVLLIGAGGLGSPAAYYLAAAGVGTLGIIDADIVDESNLQRQILHNTSRIGRLKVDSARETIEALNPDVKVVAINDRLTKENVAELVAEYDLIVDGTDNFPTRYLLNDASVIARKPVIHGSVFRFEGQLTVFKPYDGPCYRCLYPEPPPMALAPSCAEAGVLGILPGIVGMLQASEAIKLILEKGEPLVGRLLTFDALNAEFQELKLYRNPQCPACGENAHPEDLPTYEDICAL